MTMSKLAAAVAGISMLMTTPAPAAEGPTYAEKWRPQFHFTAKANWLNDPNGLVFHDGVYHLFFQHNPFGVDWGHMTWGHATSPDLVRWTQQDHALRPDATGTMYSGSAVVDWKNTSGLGRDGKPPLVAFYTAAGGKNDESKGKPFTQCLAYSNDNGKTWTKFAGNPIVPFIHAENRDPKVIWHEPTRQWVMALYLDRKHQFALFTSPDLKQWTKLHDVTLDGDDECPDFFPLAIDGDPAKTRWVFIGANNRYLIGQFDGKQFVAETDALPSEFGPNFYAAQTYSDEPHGRRVQIGWMRRDGRYPDDMPFNQQMSFPAELTLRSTPRGPRLFRWPVKEIESLYADAPRTMSGVTLKPDVDALPGLDAELLDLSLEVDPGTARDVTLDIRGLRVAFHAETTHAGSLTAWDRRVSLPLVDGRFKLRVLVDRTSVEVFANDGAVVLSGCHLPKEDRKTISLTASGGEAKVVALEAQPLSSAWTETPR